MVTTVKPTNVLCLHSCRVCVLRAPEIHSQQMSSVRYFQYTVLLTVVTTLYMELIHATELRP